MFTLADILIAQGKHRDAIALQLQVLTFPPSSTMLCPPSLLSQSFGKLQGCILLSEESRYLL